MTIVRRPLPASVRLQTVAVHCILALATNDLAAMPTQLEEPGRHAPDRAGAEENLRRYFRVQPTRSSSGVDLGLEALGEEPEGQNQFKEHAGHGRGTRPRWHFLKTSKRWLQP